MVGWVGFKISPNTLFAEEYGDENEDKKQDAQTDRDPKQRLFNSTPGGENAAAGILTRQPAQSDAFTLQHHTDNQGNCRYNQKY